jgi:hypothetical protein
MSEQVQGETPQQEQSQPVLNPEDANLAREQAAFDTYVKNQGLAVPDNFENTTAWFNSLKEAQGQYTKARQEISDLKKQYEETGVVPDRPESEQPQQSQEQYEAKGDLRIDPKPEPVVPDLNENWNVWQRELATTGDFAPETREAIKSAMRVDDGVVDTFIAGQKALRKDAYNNAADVVGDHKTLDTILEWAGESLTEAERNDLNAMLAGPSYKTALLGLKTRFDLEQASKPKSQEPARVRGENVSDAQEQPKLEIFRSRQEMNAAISDPRYKMDPNYRQLTEMRISATMNSGIFTR